MFGMTPSRRRGDGAIAQLRDQFDSMVDQLMGRWPVPQEWGSMRLWDFNVDETDNEMVVRAEMPGFRAEDINVELQHDVLSISAERRDERNPQEFRSYRRSITLTGIDPERINASYRNGVLELRMPKSAQTSRRRIPVTGESRQAKGNGAESSRPATEKQPASEGGTPQAGNIGPAATAEARQEGEKRK